MVNWEYLFVLTPLVMAAIISTTLAVHAWRRRPARGSLSFAAVMLALLVWTLGYLASIHTQDLQLKRVWISIVFIGVVTLPVAWLVFACQYTGKDQWLNRQTLGLLLVIPALTLAQVWLASQHTLFFRDLSVQQIGPFWLLRMSFGPGFYIHAIYSYLLIFVGAVLIARYHIGLPSVYLGQKLTILGSLLLPLAVNITEVLGLWSFTSFDLTLFAFAISGLGLSWGLHGFRFLDLVPLAREVVIENMSDGVIILDERRRIKDLNLAAGEILGAPPKSLVGKKAVEACSSWVELASFFKNLSEGRDEVVKGEGDRAGYFDVRMTGIKDTRGEATGWLVVLSDITQRKREEENQRRRGFYLEVFNKVVIESTAATDMQGMVAAVLDLAVQALHLDMGEAWVMAHATRRNLPEEAGSAIEKLLFSQDTEKASRLVIHDLEVKSTTSKPGEPELTLIGMGIRALLAAPVYLEDHYAGRLVVLDSTPREWDEGESALLEGIGRQVGVATERLLHLGEIEASNTQMARLIEQSEALSHPATVEEVVQAIKQGAMALCNADRVDLRINDPNQQVFFSTGQSLLEEPPENLVDGAAEETLGQETRVPMPVLISDINPLPDARAEPEASGEANFRAMGLWPLVYEGRPVAVIRTYFDRSHTWSRVEQDVMRSFTRQAAVALENARLLESEHQQRVFSEALRNVASALNSTLDFNEVLERILENLALVVPHDAASIMLLEGKQARVVGQHGYPPEEPGARAHPLTIDVDSTPNLQRMFQDGETVLISDTQNNQSFVEFAGSGKIRSYLGAPVLSKGGIIGFISLHSATTGFFTPHNAEHLQAFADQAAIAIENAGLYESLQNQADEAAALYRAATHLFDPGSDLKSLAEQITKAVTHEFDSAHCSVLLVDENGSELKLIAQGGYLQLNPQRLPLNGMGLTVEAFGSGEAIYVADVTRDPRYVAGTDQTRSELVFPLRVRGEVIGVLNLESPQLGAFDESDHRIVSAFTEIAALALENAQLMEAAGLQAYQMSQLNAITRASLETTDIHAMLKQMALRLVELFKADNCYINFWDEAGRRVLPGVVAGETGEAYWKIVTEVGEPTITETVLTLQHSLVIEDTYNSPYISERIVQQFATRSALGLPLIAGGQKYGAAIVGYNQLHRFTPEEVSFGEQTAGQIALGIARARSWETSQRRAQEAENLRQASAAVTSALDYRQVLDSILNYLDHVVPFDSACVFLLEERNVRAVAARGFANPQEILDRVFPTRNSLLSEVIKQGLPLVLEDAQADVRFKRWGNTDYVRGWMGVPLVSYGQKIGFLTLDSRQVGAFTQEQARLVQAFANQAAVAIENARLFSEVQQLAITDALTGLYNRRGMFNLGQREVERAKRFQRPLSAIMLDIDFFKKINDTYKHVTGDQVLRELAARCSQYTREIDIVVRYGGEEIVVLLPETDLEGAQIVAEHLRQIVAAKSFKTDRGMMAITISLGVAESPRGELSLEALVDRADAAMYDAKQSGRNCVRVYSLEMPTG